MFLIDIKISWAWFGLLCAFLLSETEPPTLVNLSVCSLETIHPPFIFRNGQYLVQTLSWNPLYRVYDRMLFKIFQQEFIHWQVFQLLRKFYRCWWTIPDWACVCSSKSMFYGGFHAVSYCPLAVTLVGHVQDRSYKGITWMQNWNLVVDTGLVVKGMAW